MATIVHDQGAFIAFEYVNGYDTTGMLTLDGNQNRMVIVAMSHKPLDVSTDPTAEVTIDGTQMTRILKIRKVGATRQTHSSLFYLADPNLPPSGSYLCIGTTDYITGVRGIGYDSFSNVIAGIDASVGAINSSVVNSIQTNITTANENSLVIDFISSGGITSNAPTFNSIDGTRTWAYENDPLNLAMAMSYKWVPTAGVTNSGWTWDETNIERIAQILAAVSPNIEYNRPPVLCFQDPGMI